MPSIRQRIEAFSSQVAKRWTPAKRRQDFRNILAGFCLLATIKTKAEIDDKHYLNQALQKPFAEVLAELPMRLEHLKSAAIGMHLNIIEILRYGICCCDENRPTFGELLVLALGTSVDRAGNILGMVKSTDIHVVHLMLAFSVFALVVVWAIFDSPFVIELRCKISGYFGMKTSEIAALRFADEAAPDAGHMRLYKHLDNVYVVRDPVQAKKILSDSANFSRSQELKLFAEIFQLENAFTTDSSELHRELHFIMRDSVRYPQRYHDKLFDTAQRIIMLSPNGPALGWLYDADKFDDFVDATVLRIFAATYLDLDEFPEAEYVTRTVKNLWSLKTQIEDAGHSSYFLRIVLWFRVRMLQGPLLKTLADTARLNQHNLAGNSNYETINGAVDFFTSAENRSTDETRKHNLLNILIPGYETTGRILTKLVKHLLTNQEIVASITSEASRYVANPSFEALEECHMLEATWREALRLFSAPPNLYRKVVGTATPFEKDSRICVSLQLMHTDPNRWESSRKFKPERWLDSNGQVIPVGGRYFAPFGIGSQMCVAPKFAGMLAKTFLANIYGRYSVEEIEAKILVRLRFSDLA